MQIDLGAKPPEKNGKLKKFKDLTEGLVSVSGARNNAIEHAPRVQMAFSNVPEPIRESFKLEAMNNGMELKEFFYHCLRAGGVDVPEYGEFDARKR